MEKNSNQEVAHHDLNVYLKIAGIACLGVLTLFLVTKTINEAKTYTSIGENGAEYSRSITVKGHGEITAVPNIATFSWTATEQGKTIQEAQDKAAQKSNSAIAYLEKQGVKREDISTNGFNTSEIYDARPCVIQYEADAKTVAPCPPAGKINGYTTYQTVSVKVRDSKNGKKAGEYIAEIGKLGLKTTDVSYTFDDKRSLTAAAQQAAIYDARQQAEKLAKSLGVRISRVVSFSDQDYGYGYGGGDMIKSAVMEQLAPVAPDLPSGDRKITSDVMITYSLK